VSEPHLDVLVGERSRAEAAWPAITFDLGVPQYRSAWDTCAAPGRSKGGADVVIDRGCAFRGMKLLLEGARVIRRPA
jgi:hypothetical protein